MINKMENKNNETIERNYVVYKHTSPSGKVYIGITRLYPYEKRWRHGNGYKSNKYFYSAIQKYEWNNFKHEIIENNLTKEQAENMEIELIAKYRSNDKDFGYNIESGGNAIGKVSDETKKKMSDAKKGIKLSSETKEKMSENSTIAKKVFCDELIFKCINECAKYYNINNANIERWLQGKNKMPLDFQKLNLRYATNDDLNKCEKYDTSKHGDKANIVIGDNRSKFIHCDNLIFKSITDCANYYRINNSTIKGWLQGKNPMNTDFQKLNLRYATNDDLNKYEKYDINKHGENANIVINVNKIGKAMSKYVYCNGIVFNSLTECANYYSIKMVTMSQWLTGKHKMPLDFQKLNLRYATNDDINKCEKYDINKHGENANIVINVNETYSKNVHCDNLIFKSITDCANYYEIDRMTMSRWLKGKVKMNSDFQQLNLRYATDEDLNTYPRYTLANN